MLFAYFFIAVVKGRADKFNPNLIFIRPSSMTTKNLQEGFYEYNFTGVQFQIFGSYDKNYTIYLDDKFKTTVNYVPPTSSHPQYISEILPFGKHNIKLISSDQAFKINKFGYLPTSNVRRIDYNFFDKSGSWTEANDYIYSTYSGSSLKITIRCAKFWVYGIEDNYHGQIAVKYGNVLDTTFSEKSEKPNYDIHCVYESPDFQITEGELTLTNYNQETTMKSTSFAYILILAEPLPYPDADPVPVSGESMGELNTENNDKFKCPQNEASSEPCGLFQVTKNTNQQTRLDYTFTGVRFQVFGTFGPDLGKYRIYLDDVELATINQNFGDIQYFALQYTSDIFVYGDHTIRVEADAGQKIEIYKFTYTISLRAKFIGIDKFEGGGTLTSNALGGQYYYKSGVAFSSTVSCSKFWVIGDKWESFGNMHVTYGEHFRDKIYKIGGSGQKLFTILAESPVLPFGPNKLIISGDKYLIYHGIYYIDETEIDEIPVSVSIRSFSSPNYDSGKEYYTHSSCPSDKVATSPCGEICRTKVGYSVTFEYKFTGVKFQIFGSTGSSHLNAFNIYIDKSLFGRFNERIGKEEKYSLLYTSHLLQYGEHTIKFESDEVYEIHKITYWVSTTAKRVNVTDLLGAEDWIKTSDGTGGFQLKPNKSPYTIKSHLCTNKFWIIGFGYYNTPSDCLMKIYMGKKDVSFNVFVNYDFSLIYESPELTFFTDELSIESSSNYLQINCIYYLDNCPPPTEIFSKTESFSLSTHFSSSMPFSDTNKFTKSSLFSETMKFAQTDAFSNSMKFSKSDSFLQTDKFSKTDFFSQTGKFSKSNFFSQTDKFSKTDFFSQTGKFSKSDFFSQTGKFSKTDFFSQTGKFSKSDFFSQTDKFSGTFIFSETVQFSESEVFRDSNDFISSKDSETPSEISSEETPSGISSEETPSEISSEEIPSEISSEETPSGISSEETPSEISSEETPSEISSEETPSEISPEKSSNEIASEGSLSIISLEEQSSKIPPEQLSSETSLSENTELVSSSKTKQ